MKIVYQLSEKEFNEICALVADCMMCQGYWGGTYNPVTGEGTVTQQRQCNRAVNKLRRIYFKLFPWTKDDYSQPGIGTDGGATDMIPFFMTLLKVAVIEPKHEDTAA